ncbi:MAG: hypothetical protein DHS20C18_41370 [Saprospiraceae bacterium]|nr:MAG: hypothetical protein DHS20C18_41370 [Saprospiraceae bacterium]
MIKRKLCLFLSGLILLLAACSQFDDFDNIKGVDYDGEYALPLVNTTTSIGDLLENFEENSSLVIDPDGLIRFQYSGDVLTETSDKVFAAINETLIQGGIIPLATDTTPLPFDLPGGLQIDRLDLKTGKFTYAFQSTNPEQIHVVLTVPGATKNGNPLRFEFNIAAYSGSGNASLATNAIFPASLEGYSLVPEDNGNINIVYHATLPNGDPVTPDVGGILIEDLSFYYAEGYLGQDVYEGTRDTIEIDFFEDWSRGDIYFADPRITVNFENSFGVPTRSKVDVFDIFTVREEVLPLESEFIENGIDFPYPELNEVGQVKYKSFTFDKNNSNIDVVLGAGPLAIDYEVDASINPDMDTTIRGFITDSSYYKVRVDVDLPLYGWAFDFLARDTFEINLDSYENVEEAEFKIVTENDMPLGVDIQGYFVDENGVVLDSLLDDRQQLILPASVDGDGVANETARAETFVSFPAERFDKIIPAKSLILVAYFSSKNAPNTYVKILANQDVNIRIGAKFKVHN